jgi:hypothetical protein
VWEGLDGLVHSPLSVVAQVFMSPCAPRNGSLPFLEVNTDGSKPITTLPVP